MAIDRLINSTQGDSIISALGASGSIATSLAAIAAKSNTPYNTDNKLNTQYTTLTGYEKASSVTAIAASDNVPNALGKLEYKVDTNTADISTNTNNISYNTNTGVKNLLNIPDGTYTVTGLTVVATGGELTFTSTNATTHAIVVGNFNLKAGTYVLSDRASGNKGYDIRLFVDGTNVTTTAETSTFTLSDEKTVEIRFYSYATITNQTIKPMLCLKPLYDADPTYQPYALSNAELTAKERVNENNIYSIISNSYKNKLHYKSEYVAGFTQTIGEVTFTINDDLSITANSNGNAVTANRTFSIYNGLPLHVAGDIISGGVSSQCSVECELATNPYTNYGYSTTGVGIMTAATGTVEVFCRVKAGAAVNVTFYPMICDAGFFTVTNSYEPFRAPNLRLVQDKKIMLKDSSITWRQSSAGLYYTDPIAISGIDYVVSAMLTQFAYLSDSNIIQVIGSPTAHNSVRFIANSDSINESAYVMITVLGF